MSKFTVYGYMYQFSTRKNLVDILLEPNSIALLGSIALHAIIAANLSLLIQPEKPGKKIDLGSVKVVELKPDEVQRIPQAPKSALQPIPNRLFPDITPPVEPPTSPTIPAPAPTSRNPIAVNPRTVPSAPIRTTPSINPRSTARTIPQPQPAAPTFSRNPFGGKSPKQPEQKLPPSPKPIVPSPLNSNPTDNTPTPTPVPTRSPQPQPTTTRSPQPQPTTSPGTGNNKNTVPGTPNPNPPANKLPGSPPTGDTPTLPSPINPNPPVGGETPSRGRATIPITEGKSYAEVKKELESKYPGIEFLPLERTTDVYPKGTICNRDTPQRITVVFVMNPPIIGETNDIVNPDGKPNLTPILKEISLAGNFKGSTGEELKNKAKERFLSKVNEKDSQRPPDKYKKIVAYPFEINYDRNSCQ
jgi:hypothetical protein